MRSRIVITGGPGSGKSKCLTRLKIVDRFRGFVFLDEVARRLLRGNPDYRHDKAAFHIAVYNDQVAREAELGDRSFITDRGTADAFAFHPGTRAIVGTTLAREHERYDKVVQLGTSAALGEEHYTGDDIRTESPEEALAIEKAIKHVWQEHPGYHFIPAIRDFEEKYRQLVQIIDACVAHTRKLTE